MWSATSTMERRSISAADSPPRSAALLFVLVGTLQVVQQYLDKELQRVGVVVVKGCPGDSGALCQVGDRDV